MQAPAHTRARVYFAGIQAAATYGAEVLGWSPTEIQGLRQAGARALGIAGGALDIAWSLYPGRDP
eukprot:6379947-Pyramimonas_sp.AAC.1